MGSGGTLPPPSPKHIPLLRTPPTAPAPWGWVPRPPKSSLPQEEGGSNPTRQQAKMKRDERMGRKHGYGV